MSTARFLVVLLLVSSAACAGRAAGPASESAAAWSFTDDLGVTVELPAPPDRVVAQATAAGTLADYGITPVATFGATQRPDGDRENSIGDLDVSDIPSLGSEFGELNLEALAAAAPDLVVTLTYEPTLEDARFDPYWYISGDIQSEVTAIAPIVAIAIQGDPVDRTVERFAELAGELGADLDSREITAQRDDFESAAAALSEATAAKPDLVAMFVSGYADSLYVANPEVAVDVAWFRELGLEVVAPELAEGEFWEQLSWEQAGLHDADLILNDIRGQALTTAQMTADQPTFATLPAVQAGQVADWHFESPYSYASFTAILRDLAEAVSSADAEIA